MYLLIVCDCGWGSLLCLYPGLDLFFYDFDQEVDFSRSLCSWVF